MPCPLEDPKLNYLLVLLNLKSTYPGKLFLDESVLSRRLLVKTPRYLIATVLEYQLPQRLKEHVFPFVTFCKLLDGYPLDVVESSNFASVTLHSD